MAFRSSTDSPARRPGQAATRALSPAPPSWPQASASPPLRRKSAATWTTTCPAAPHLPGTCPSEALPRPRSPPRPSQVPTGRQDRARPAGRRTVLHRPARGKLGTRLPLRRGFTPAATGEWHIGYAPRGWTALTTISAAAAIQTRRSRPPGWPGSPPAEPSSITSATGSCCPSTTSTASSPVSSAAPAPAPDRTPKYLNSPATSTYRKGDLLFGLYHAHAHLARGATPVIAEGPFDAIAVTLADPGRYAGAAPCGTALTSRQAETLAQAADLSGTECWSRSTTTRRDAKPPSAPTNPPRRQRPPVGSRATGKDPAEILETDGAPTLQGRSSRTMCSRCPPWSSTRR